jgi:hypothetical protein
MAITGCQLQNVPVGRIDMPGLRQAGDVVHLDYPLFFIDRVEDAVPPGSQAPQIRRPVRERLRQLRLIGELAIASQSAATPMGSSLRNPAVWSRA